MKYATDRAIRRKNIDLEIIFMWPYMTLTLDQATLFKITALSLTKGTLLVMYKTYWTSGIEYMICTRILNIILLWPYLQTWFKGTANPLPNALCGRSMCQNWSRWAKICFGQEILDGQTVGRTDLSLCLQPGESDPTQGAGWWPEGVITYRLLERISAGNFFDNWS